MGTKDDMRLLVESLAELDPVNTPITPSDLSGRWELVYTTVELFRASPFFQMVSARWGGGEGFAEVAHTLTCILSFFW